MPHTAPPISGIILAGGRARRMANQDKGLIDLAGRPMIDYVIQALRPQVDELLINANRNLIQYRQFGCQVVPDQIPDFAGPLAGVAAGLETARHDLLLSVPCDGPWLPHDLVNRLFLQLQTEQADLCVVHDGQRLQPVYGLFRRQLAADIRSFLAAGDRKILLWLERQRTAVADFSDHPEAFVNLNTPEEQQRIEQLIVISSRPDPKGA